LSLKAIVDTDFIKYAVACAGEKRSIQVIHKQSGREKEFKTRTEFYGRDKKKSGGWLGELNKNRTSPFMLDEFEIVDVQTPEPLNNVLHSAKLMFQRTLEKVGTTKYKGYIGKGDSFRVNLSTIIKYKGNREETLRAVYMQEVEDYLIKKFNLETVRDYEADDVCVMDCYKNPDNVLVGVDKDYAGQPVRWFNPNNPDVGIQDCDCFGKLFLSAKGHVKGIGRAFLYHQIGSGDSSDNYKANSASERAWGDKSSFDILSQATNDKEALEGLVRIYKEELYPEPVMIKGWRGDEFEVDWLYVLEENFQMARMKRFEGDDVYIKEVLQRFGLL
jgi:hypothetical protein